MDGLPHLTWGRPGPRKEQLSRDSDGSQRRERKTRETNGTSSLVSKREKHSLKPLGRERQTGSRSNVQRQTDMRLRAGPVSGTFPAISPVLAWPSVLEK